MENISLNLFSLACYTYIIANLICAAVRWFHMCPPYDKDEDYFYPARRQLTFVLAASLLQIPYVFLPADEGTWVYIRCMTPVFYSLGCSMLFIRYFLRIRLGKNWKTRMMFYLPMSYIMGLLLTVTTGKSHYLAIHARWLYAAAFIGSILLMIPYMLASNWLRRRINDFHEQNYSNPSQFPYRLAEKVLYVPIIWMIVIAAISISGDRTLKMVCDYFCSVWIICILCLTLKPNRSMRSAPRMKDVITEDQYETAGLTDDKETEIGAEEPVLSFGPDVVGCQGETEETLDEQKDDGISSKGKDRKDICCQNTEETVRQEVLAIISRRYQEPDLKRTDVISEVGYRRKKLAGAYITRLSFYKLVNAFRLWNLEIYMSEHPNIGTEAAAIHNGFKDRWALHNARKRVADFDYRLIRDFLPEK